MVNKYAHLTGGADQNCLALIVALIERGHDVAILSTASDRNTVGEGVFIEPTVTHQTRGALPRSRQGEVFARALWNPAAARGAHEAIARFHPDVVHSHKLYPQLSVAPIVIAARAGLPVVQTLHDYELLSASALDHTGRSVDRDESRASYRVLNTATFPVRRMIHARRVSAFIACSRFVAGRYRSRRGTESTVMPYFVEAPGRATIGFAERDGVLFVGRLHEEKGVRDVIGLAERLPAIHVSIAGYGPLEAFVAEAERRLANLRFLGRQGRSKLWDLLERARVAVMPSRWQEPGGIAALEAMAVGTPVVAYANGGLAEYVAGTGGGRVVAPDVDALAEAVGRVHGQEEDWRERSEAAIAGIARLHNADAYVSRLEALYRSVLARD
jgi:glycosyltransferase involved in cell wall biosynthesis